MKTSTGRKTGIFLLLLCPLFVLGMPQRAEAEKLLCQLMMAITVPEGQAHDPLEVESGVSGSVGGAQKDEPMFLACGGGDGGDGSGSGSGSGYSTTVSTTVTTTVSTTVTTTISTTVTTTTSSSIFPPDGDPPEVLDLPAPGVYTTTSDPAGAPSADGEGGAATGGETGTSVTVDVKLASVDVPLNCLTGAQVDFTLSGFFYIESLTWGSMFTMCSDTVVDGVCDANNPDDPDCDCYTSGPGLETGPGSEQQDFTFYLDYAGLEDSAPDGSPDGNCWDLPVTPESILLSVVFNVPDNTTFDVCGQNAPGLGIEVSNGWVDDPTHPLTVYTNGNGINGTCDADWQLGSNQFDASVPGDAAADGQPSQVITVVDARPIPVEPVDDGIADGISKVLVKFMEPADSILADEFSVTKIGGNPCRNVKVTNVEAYGGVPPDELNGYDLSGFPGGDSKVRLLTLADDMTETEDCSSLNTPPTPPLPGGLIEQQRWLVVRHVPSGSTIRLGNLTCDIDGDYRSIPLDNPAMLRPGLQPHQGDMDGSGGPVQNTAPDGADWVYYKDNVLGTPACGHGATLPALPDY